MPTRYRTKVIDLSDAKSLEDEAKRLTKLSRSFEYQLESVYRKVAREIDSYYFRGLKHQLAVEPDKRDLSDKVEWESEEQRKYVMMMWRKKKIKLPRKRTHELSKKWETNAVAKRNGIDFVIDNKAKHRIFVVGDLGISKRPADTMKYEQPIQKFHLTTGWQPAHRLIQPVVSDARAYAKRRTLDEVTKLINGKTKYR